MMTPIRIAACAVLVGGIIGFTQARADEAAERGREILEKHKAAVVTVQMVLKQQISFPGMSSRSDESKTEATGTVITPEGLTVVSLSETDPSSIMRTIASGMPGGQDLKMDTQVQDVKILLEDGTEVESEIILRDKDLDMAFVRPKEKPESEFAHVDFSDGASPQMLDQVISLNRLGQVANRVHSASVERIDAIVDKPRTFYIPGRDPTNTNLGSPAFTLDGEVVGIFLVRAIRSSGGGGGGLFGGMGDNVVTVLLPAVDVMESASQAPPYEES